MPLGQPVAITLRLTNRSHRPVDAQLLGRTIAFDIVIRAEDGTVVWRRLEGEVGPSILQLRTLAARETMEWSETWTQRTNAGVPVPRGTYRVSGELPGAEPGPRQAPDVRVRIE